MAGWRPSNRSAALFDYTLDTNVFVDALRQPLELDRLKAFLSWALPSTVLSSIVAAELTQGLVPTRRGAFSTTCFSKRSSCAVELLPLRSPRSAVPARFSLGPARRDVVVVGWSLPVRHRASRQATYTPPPETVFEAITKFEEFPQWRSKVQRVEMVDRTTGAQSFRQIGSDGSILYSVDEALPGQRLVTSIADKSLPFGGKWT